MSFSAFRSIYHKKDSVDSATSLHSRCHSDVSCGSRVEAGAANTALSQHNFTEWLSQEEQRLGAVCDMECHHMNARRLNPTLESVVSHKCTLHYFSAFLAERQAGDLLQFWLEADALLRRTSCSCSPAKSPPQSPAQSDTVCQNSRRSAAVIECLTRHLGDGERVAESLRSHAVAWSQCCSGEQQSVTESVAHQVLQSVVPSLRASLSHPHLTDFISSEHFHCCQVDLLTDSPREICDVLFNNLAVFCFMEFMEQEGVARYIEFWMSSTNFRENIHDLISCGKYDAHEARSDAMVLYDKYFSLQTSGRLLFSDAVRVHVEALICGASIDAGGDATTSSSPSSSGPCADCFLLPRLLLHNTLQQRYFHCFLKSAIFFNFSFNIINTMRCPSRLASIDKTDTMSECSSEVACCVTGSTVTGAECGHVLHHRRQYGLSIGHVSRVGRYESLLEPQPGSSSQSGRNTTSSRLGRVMRSLLKNDHQSVKEEMAWRIAQLIVRDVTSITMTPASSCPQ